VRSGGVRGTLERPAGLGVPAGTAMSDERRAISTDAPAVGDSPLRVRRETPLSLVALALLLAVVGAWIGYFCVLAGRSEPEPAPD
jgi:type VI protein secretion system component VasF